MILLCALCLSVVLFCGCASPSHQTSGSAREKQTVGIVNWLTGMLSDNSFAWNEGTGNIKSSINLNYWAATNWQWLLLCAGLVLLLYWSASRRAKAERLTVDGLQDAIEGWMVGLGKDEEYLAADLKLWIGAWQAGRPHARRFERMLAVKGYAHRERGFWRRVWDRVMLWST
jgi:hypothetical protein